MGSEDSGDLHIGVVVINVADVGRAARFWCAAVGYRVREPALDQEFAIIQPTAGTGVPIGLQRTDDTARQPVRLHLDLCTDDPDGQIDRLLQLGAIHAPGWPYPPDADFTVLQDPDGNEFCVIPHAGLE